MQRISLCLNVYFCQVYLQQGDKIALISPSRAIAPSEVEASESFLRSKGFIPQRAKYLFERSNQFAGTDQQKVKSIQECLDDPEIKAVWSTRGGYGSARIIDKLDFSGLQSNFKWMVGYSDFTVFHSHLNTMGVPSLHACMPINVKAEASEDIQLSLNTLIDALMGRQLSYELKVHELNQEGEATGELVGGNLSILYSLCGSPSSIDTRAKILFIEDLDEYLYHIDRMMMNLDRNGMLEGLAALIVGGMTEMNDNTIAYGKNAEEIILERCKDYSFPIYFGFQAGHLEPNRAMRFGMKASIKDNRLILFP